MWTQPGGVNWWHVGTGGPPSRRPRVCTRLERISLGFCFGGRQGWSSGWEFVGLCQPRNCSHADIFAVLRRVNATTGIRMNTA